MIAPEEDKKRLIDHFIMLKLEILAKENIDYTYCIQSLKNIKFVRVIVHVSLVRMVVL